MNEKPTPPDFPDLPAKLRSIVGEPEYQKWRKEIEDWRINLALSEEIYSGAVITDAFKNFKSTVSLNLFNIGIIAEPYTEHPEFLVNGVTERFEDKLICESDQGIFIVQPSIGFNFVGPDSTGQSLYDDGILATRLSNYYRRVNRVATSYVSGTLANPPDISGVVTKNVIEVFTPSYSPIFLSGFGSGSFTEEDIYFQYTTPPFKQGALTGVTRTIYGSFVTAYSRSVAFVKNIVIAPMSEQSLTASREITLKSDRRTPVFYGWKDMNTQSSRWTPVHLIDGQWWNGSVVNSDYTFSFYES